MALRPRTPIIVNPVCLAGPIPPAAPLPVTRIYHNPGLGSISSGELTCFWQVFVPDRLWRRRGKISGGGVRVPGLHHFPRLEAVVP